MDELKWRMGCEIRELVSVLFTLLKIGLTFIILSLATGLAVRLFAWAAGL